MEEESKKGKINSILIGVLAIVVLLVVLAYYYFFIYRAPDAVSNREIQETAEAYDYLLGDSKKGLASYEYIVLINPAHGGSDKGDSVKLEGVKINESDVVLTIAQYVKEFNDDKRIGIFVTRNTDTNPLYEQRASFVQELRPNIVIDLHISKSNQNDTMGIMSYYSSDFYRFDLTNEELADILERNVVTAAEGVALGLTDISEEPDTEYNFIKGIKVPAAAVSCGFISNDDERMALSDKAYQQTLARGILEAIREVAYE